VTEKYLAPKNERPEWAYIVDQIITKDTQNSKNQQNKLDIST